MDHRVGYNYRMEKKIGEGAFGEIYMGKEIMTGKEVAIKLESANSRNPQLQYEYKAYRLIQGGIGVSNVYYYSSEGNYNIMVMDLMGPNLEDLFNYCGRHFSMKTVCMLAREMILRVEYIHSKGFIHRDIKPDNFAVGINENANIIHILDFGLSKLYINLSTKEHIPYRENKSLIGTPRYASLNSHFGMELSRRDDLESIGYILIYFLKGKLPWQGIRADTKKDKYQRIMELKMEYTYERLCEALPIEIAKYFDYCKSLLYADSPNYSYLRQLFSTILEKNGYVDDGVYDWMEEGVKSFNSLQKYCISVNGKIRKDLLNTAPMEYRCALTIDSVQPKEENEEEDEEEEDVEDEENAIEYVVNRRTNLLYSLTSMEARGRSSHSSTRSPKDSREGDEMKKDDLSNKESNVANPYVERSRDMENEVKKL